MNVIQLNRFRSITAALFAFFLLIPAIIAQDITKGSIAGVVRDPSGSVILGG